MWNLTQDFEPGDELVHIIVKQYLIIQNAKNKA